MLLFFIQQSVANASELVITARHDMVPIYEDRGGELSEIGAMRIGESMIVNRDYDENLWEVKFGNAYGYVDKQFVEPQGNVGGVTKNKRANTNNVVLINRDTDVFSSTAGQLKRFAVIKGGYRYPILEDFGNWWQIDAGGRVGYIHKASTSIDKGIPVLMYHHILTKQEKEDSPYANVDTTIIDTEFYEQMDFLKMNGYEQLLRRIWKRHEDGEVNLPSKAVVITIDDGNISSREYAYPKLKEHGFVADQFIITSRIPRTSQTLNHKRLYFLSQNEMDEMSDVFTYLGHTHDLHSLTRSNESFLIAKSRDIITQDLLVNRSLLNNTRYFAYPYGKYNDETLEILQETGFTLAYTTKTGLNKSGMNKLTLPRIGIGPYLSIEGFAKKVGND